MAIERVIIAGSRKFTDQLTTDKVLDGIFPEAKGLVIVCGEAAGPDTLGKRWGLSRGHSIASFPADWDNLEAPGAVIRTTKSGKKYNAIAGHVRNEEMAKYANAEGTGALVVFWDGKSKGTKNMIDLAKRYKLRYRIILIDTDEEKPVDPSLPIGENDPEVNRIVARLEQRWQRQEEGYVESKESDGILA